MRGGRGLKIVLFLLKDREGEGEGGRERENKSVDSLNELNGWGWGESMP